MKRRVLFVEDRPVVSRGLRKMLRSMHKIWEVRFTSTGKEALNMLRGGDFDVVVAGSSVPGFNDSQLLDEVKDCHPQVVRIVLSGSSDGEHLLRTAKSAHQFLSMPLDSKTLVSSISRACKLRDLLYNDSLKSLVSKIDSLPSMPALYGQLMKELNSSNSSVHRVGRIIAKDIGMTAKVLQLVNSAFFGLRHHVTSPAQAVSLLGLNTIKSLVLSVQVFSRYDGNRMPGLSIDKLWNHCFITGLYAREIARSERLDQNMVDDSFMAGLLHDVGKLVLAFNFPGLYAKTMILARRTGIPVWKAEMEMFGSSHSDVGAYLMGLWGLPYSLVEAIAFHHWPFRVMEKGLSPMIAVHIGNIMQRDAGATDVVRALDDDDFEFLDALGLTERLPIWQEACRGVMERERGGMSA